MATAVDETASAPKGGMKKWLFLGIAALLAVGAGVALPMFLVPKGAPPTPSREPKKAALIPFGEVVVNLGEERLTRYLRVKLLLVVDHTQEKAITELLAKQRPFLKSWLISYLSDQSLQEVSRAAGVNRVRREILDRFNAMLFPDGAERIQDLLFDEFVVQ